LLGACKTGKLLLVAMSKPDFCYPRRVWPLMLFLRILYWTFCYLSGSADLIKRLRVLGVIYCPQQLMYTPFVRFQVNFFLKLFM